ncbi:MAG TPA: hypothetical protein VIY90_11815 [Steroidobacteraceae bacterium]
MAKQREDQQDGVWTPKVERKPFFTKSADLERALGEDRKTPDIDIVDEGFEDGAEEITPDAPNPFIRPKQ